MITRETWLDTFTSRARQHFATLGHTVPENLRLSISSPAINSNKRSDTGKVLGECWHPDASQDGHYEIFITADPHNKDSAQIAAAVTHELCHSVTGLAHDKRFGSVARAVGLEGPLTATYPGPLWAAWALPIIAELGPIPYAAIDYSKPPKPKRNPSAPIGHTCGECGAQAWITKKNITRFDYIACINPACKGVMLPKESDTEE